MGGVEPAAELPRQFGQKKAGTPVCDRKALDKTFLETLFWGEMKVYFDGKFVASDDAKVSVFDHGLLYGDGVFEGIRLYGGNVFRLDEHLERLEYSAKEIGRAHV